SLRSAINEIVCCRASRTQSASVAGEIVDVVESSIGSSLPVSRKTQVVSLAFNQASLPYLFTSCLE
ncbi:MAG TPA: hypothetical protein VGG61_10990, partial [Gemmataceae bacterium]